VDCFGEEVVTDFSEVGNLLVGVVFEVLDSFGLPRVVALLTDGDVVTGEVDGGTYFDVEGSVVVEVISDVKS
jgi:hypothetical protein